MNQSEHATPAMDDPRVVEALEEYLTALESGAQPSRAAFLARHADVAEALAACLDGIEALHAHRSSASKSGGLGGASESPEWKPGTPLGDFRIIREIGRGGMGVVYEAEQLSLGRRIALKVLPFALTLDPRQLQRFKNEARAAAQLHHQHIVPIHFVGEERGVHFFAMQYVDGQSLAEVIQELRWLAGRKAQRETAVDQVTETGRGRHENPRGGEREAAERQQDRTLSPCHLVTLSAAHGVTHSEFFRAAAQLGVQAAEALEHAHQYGVVHRDIKPANVLVDAQGNLWIADFGLAQFQSDSALTLSGDLLGTLRYMSPEQAMARRGLVDHRTDIYSLGATLYELLTLEPPYSGRDRQELLRQIAFEEPRPPSNRNPGIPADLETIILKAMAKAVEERYSSARELADDLRSFLEHKPIRARRPSVLERGRKCGRRHQALVGMGVLLLLVTVVALAASTVLVWREQEKTLVAFVREKAKALEADEQQTRAEESFREARQAVDFFTQLIENDTTSRPGPFQGPQHGLRRKALEAALAYYESFLAQRRDDLSVQAELAVSRERVARLLSELATLQGLGHLMLLNVPSVLDDLKLEAADNQRQQLQKLTRGFEDKQHALFGPQSKLTSEQRQRAFVDLAAAHDREVSALLTPEQSRRLNQIDLQFQGPRAFADPDVIKALALTSAQQERIRELQTRGFGGPPFEPRPPMGSKKGSAKGPPPFEGRHNPDFGRQVTMNSILESLTDEQRARWNELVGERFTGQFHFGPPRGGPGPGPGPRPGGEH